MATRKDLLKAQAFTSRRMIAAFVNRDPDDPTPPLKRVGTATFVSVLLGVVLLAGTALLGIISGGASKDQWAGEDNVVLSDPKSGALFVQLEGKVIPVTDVASARLLAAGPDATSMPRVIDIATNSMEGQKVEPMQGIPGAPRQLPDAKTLEQYPLRLCSTADRYLTLEFGRGDTTTNAAIVVRGHDESEYLLVDGRLHQLYSRPGQPSGLAQNLPVAELGASWISAIPIGASIDEKEVPGYGEPADFSSLKFSIGQMAVVRQSDGMDRYYIQLNDGLARIAYLDMKLIQQQENDPREPSEITDLDVVENQSETENFSDEGVPMFEPRPPEGYTSLRDVAICATFEEGDATRVKLSIGQTTPTIPADIGVPSGGIDLISSPPMRGALLRNADITDPDAAATVLLLNGRSYPIPTASDRAALGYGDVKPMAVPGSLISLFRPGLGDRLALSRESVIPVGR